MIAWCDYVWHLGHEDARVTVAGHTRGSGTGRRILRTQHTATCEAKSRTHMPDRIPVPSEHGWSAVAPHLPGGGCRRAIEARMASLDDETRAKVADALERAGTDERALARILARIEEVAT